MLADDSDFYVYPVKRYFLADDLAWSEDRRPRTNVFDGKARREFFGVPDEVLPVLSCLIGNDYCCPVTDMKPFHDFIRLKVRLRCFTQPLRRDT